MPVDRLYADPAVESERRNFFLVTAVLLAPFLLLTAWFMAGANPGRPWDAAGFVLAPSLLLTGLINWDLVATALLAGAFWAWSRDRPVLAGVMVGLGTAAKLYPVLLLGAFLVVALRRRRLGDAGAAVAGALAAWLVVDVPVLLRSPDGWLGFWRFNADRGPDLGSLWLVAQQMGHSATPHLINVTSWALLGVVSLGVLVLGLRAPEVPRVAQLMLLVLLGFLLLVPARAHRALGVLALVVSLAAAAAVIALVSGVGWQVDRFGPGMWCAVAVPALGLLGALKAMLTAPRVTLAPAEPVRSSL
jgi:uncharacterized membrane protein